MKDRLGNNTQFTFLFNDTYSISAKILSHVFSREDVRVIEEVFDSSRLKQQRLFHHFPKAYRFCFHPKLNVKAEDIQDRILIMDNETLSYLEAKDISFLKKHAKALVLLLIDELHNQYRSINTAREMITKGYFDLIYSYSDHDCKEYNLRKMTSYYSQFDLPETKAENDLFFIGNVKTREKEINQIYQNCQKAGFKPDFYVAGKTKENIPGIHYIQYLSYQESLALLKKSRCILDLADNHNYGPSLRYFEAIVYQKKLITNNDNIKDFPFYAPSRMQVISSIDDIDYAWIRKESKEYTYSGEFEPIHLLETILNDVSLLKKTNPQ